MSCFVMNPEPLATLANAVEARLNCDYGYRSVTEDWV